MATSMLLPAAVALCLLVAADATGVQARPSRNPNWRPLWDDQGSYDVRTAPLPAAAGRPSGLALPVVLRRQCCHAPLALTWHYTLPTDLQAPCCPPPNRP